MPKTIVILGIFLFLVSCGQKGHSGLAEESLETTVIVPEESPVSADTTLPAPQTSPPPIMASTFEVRARLVGFNREQEDKLLRAIELIKQVVASNAFRAAILNKTYNGKKGFVDSAGLTNAQVYRRILEASETLSKYGKNNRMDVELQIYQDTSNVVGYTYPNVTRIWMNRKYFDAYDPTQVADNLFHEWLHKIGFTHAFEYSPSRDHSVPYWVGRTVKRLAKKYL